MRIDSEHLQELIRDGKAFAIDREITNRLVGYLEKLPWSASGLRLDWGEIDGVELELSQLTDEVIAERVRMTPLGRDEYLIFVLGRNEPCFACNTELGIRRFDFIFSGLPGYRYFFGAELRDGAIQPILNHFAEFNSADSLVIAT